MTPAQRVDLLRAACCVAGADGTTTEREHGLIQKLAKQEGVGAASVNAMIERAQCDPEFCKEQFRVLKSDPRESIAVLVEVAMADGQLESTERTTLKALADNLEIPDSTFDELIQRVAQMIEKQGD